MLAILFMSQCSVRIQTLVNTKLLPLASKYDVPCVDMLRVARLTSRIILRRTAAQLQVEVYTQRISHVLKYYVNPHYYVIIRRPATQNTNDS